MTIGQLARRAGIGLETVRFYEKQGLLEQPPRPHTGYRRYPEEALRRLEFIRRAKTLGFSLSEIRDLMRLRLDPQVSCADVRERAQLKLAQVHTKMDHLSRMRRALDRLIDTCSGSGSTESCPILEAMSEEDEDRPSA